MHILSSLTNINTRVPPFHLSTRFVFRFTSPFQVAYIQPAPYLRSIYWQPLHYLPQQYFQQHNGLFPPIKQYQSLYLPGHENLAPYRATPSM